MAEELAVNDEIEDANQRGAILDLSCGKSIVALREGERRFETKERLGVGAALPRRLRHHAG